MKKLYKQEVIEELGKISIQLRNVRDRQEAIPCMDGSTCMCNAFDVLMDGIRNLLTTFEKEGTDK